MEIQSPLSQLVLHRHHQSSSARRAPSLPACQHPPQSVVTLVKGTHLVPTLQSAVASKAAGVPCPWVGRPIWHREQDTFSGGDGEAANVSHSQAHFCLQCIWCPTGWRSKGCVYLPVWRGVTTSDSSREGLRIKDSDHHLCGPPVTIQEEGGGAGLPLETAGISTHCVSLMATLSLFSYPGLLIKGLQRMLGFQSRKKNFPRQELFKYARLPRTRDHCCFLL